MSLKIQFIKFKDKEEFMLVVRDPDVKFEISFVLDDMCDYHEVMNSLTQAYEYHDRLLVRTQPKEIDEPIPTIHTPEQVC